VDVYVCVICVYQDVYVCIVCGICLCACIAYMHLKEGVRSALRQLPYQDPLKRALSVCIYAVYSAYVCAHSLYVFEGGCSLSYAAAALPSLSKTCEFCVYRDVYVRIICGICCVRRGSGCGQGTYTYILTRTHAYMNHFDIHTYIHIGMQIRL
jgi:hypothetical protein